MYTVAKSPPPPLPTHARGIFAAAQPPPLPDHARRVFATAPNVLSLDYGCSTVTESSDAVTESSESIATESYDAEQSECWASVGRNDVIHEQVVRSDDIVRRWYHGDELSTAAVYCRLLLLKAAERAEPPPLPAHARRVFAAAAEPPPLPTHASDVFVQPCASNHARRRYQDELPLLSPPVASPPPVEVKSTEGGTTNEMHQPHAVSAGTSLGPS